MSEIEIFMAGFGFCMLAWGIGFAIAIAKGATHDNPDF